MNKLLIIDGNSLLFRAYYATAYPGVEIMRNQEGIPTNAVFAFSNMINKILSTVKPGDGIMVSFDTGKKTFRHQLLDTYKANRKPAPEDLVIQFPIAREFLRKLNVYQFEEEGFEGDDIAGTIAKKAEKEGIEVTLYTSDRDFLQLVSDKITVNILKKGLSDILEMTPSLVKETFGFEPKQIIDYKGLRGDSSDNLPGIPGIGEKTAVKLIEQYGSFDNIMAHASEIKGKVGEMLIEHKDIGTLSRDLAIIQTDIDLPFSPSDTEYKGYDFAILNEFCQKYGLKTFINKVTPKWKMESSVEEINFKEITSFSNVDIPNKIGLALDFDEEDYHNSSIAGIAIATNKENYYISLDNALKDKKLLSVLEDENIKKYCYDFKAIKVALANNNISLKGLEFDILIAAYLLDSACKNNMDMVMNIFGANISKDETVSLFGNQNGQRTVEIAHYCINLYNEVFSRLKSHNMEDLYLNLEIPLVNTLADMEIEGFALDKNTLNGLGDIYRTKTKELAEKIYELAGEKFNIASPKQLGEILFNKLGLKGDKKGSTNVDVLKDLLDKHPIVPLILEYRKYFKLLSTYVDGLIPHIYEDGKIHACFNQALTTTGRLSSSNPNLQNISVRDEDGKQIRKAFFYPNYEYEILSFDYSQIELRVLAHLSNCKALKEIFASGEDIHSGTAKTIFGLTSEPTDLQRRKAKTVNFGIVYGISDWGLADQLGISNKEAHMIIEKFYESFPEVRDFFQNIIFEATKNGYVSTILGRRRYLRELHDSNYQTREFAKRAAMNAPIQGTAADLIKLAMIQVDKKLKEGNFKTKMVCQVHDELLFKVPKDEKEQVYDLIKDTMEHALTLSVELKVDGGFGKDWFSIK